MTWASDVWDKTTHEEPEGFRLSGAGETVHGCSLLFSQYDFALSLADYPLTTFVQVFDGNAGFDFRR